MCLRHPWSLCRPFKVDKLSSFDRLSFRTELTFTFANCTFDFILSYHSEHCTTKEGRTIINFKNKFLEQVEFVLIKPFLGVLCKN